MTTTMPPTKPVEAPVRVLKEVAEKRDDRGGRVVQRVLADIGAAGTATMGVAPFVCIIDRSIMENASGRSESVMASVKSSFLSLLKRPDRFIFSKPFGLVFMTYFGTYIAANLVDTTSSVRNGTDIQAKTAGTEKFIATSGTNIGLGLVKDRNFARIFGTGSPRPVPLPSLALFTVRDAMTILFSFNIPPMLAPLIPQNSLLNRESTAQFLAPAACQFLSTPLHLLGLDLYNRGEKISFSARVKTIRENYLPSALARMGRIVPAFGFGGVANAKVRHYLLERIEQSG